MREPVRRTNDPKRTWKARTDVLLAVNLQSELATLASIGEFDGRFEHVVEVLIGRNAEGLRSAWLVSGFRTAPAID